MMDNNNPLALQAINAMIASLQRDYGDDAARKATKIAEAAIRLVVDEVNQESQRRIAEYTHEAP